MPNQWIPISEAPKDGTEVLLQQKPAQHEEYFSPGRAVVGCYLGEWCQIALDGERMPLMEEWFSHFMFLPDPPNTER